MNEGIDVAVVGGGPCGSFAALTAAKLGAKVAVCEEHKEVGVPAHCPGHVSVRGLKLLGLDLPRRIVENEIRGAIFYSPSGKEFTIRCSSPVTVVVNRELFDQHLSTIATKAGVQYMLQARVESMLFDSGFAKGVVLRKKDGEETLESKVVIDAEGCSSPLLRRVNMETLDRSMLVRGINAEVDSVENVDEDRVEVYFGQSYAPVFFAWIIPRKDAAAKIGLATRIGNPREYLNRFMRKHPIASKRLRRSEITKLSFHPISLGGAIPKTYSSGLLVVGDSASQVKPTTGGGIIFGLLCSKLAGEIAYEAVKNNDFSESFMSQYQTLWKKQIDFDLKAARQLRLMLNRIPDDKMDNIIDLSARFGLDQALEEAGDLDFEGRSLVRMARYPAAWMVAFYSFFSSITSKPLARIHGKM